MKAESVGLIEGWQWNQNSPMVSLLQFADDKLCFLGVEDEEVHNLRSILLLFEAASGLKVKLRKSNILGVG